MQNEESELEQVEQELSEMNKTKSGKEADKRKTNLAVSLLGMIFSQVCLERGMIAGQPRPWEWMPAQAAKLFSTSS
jgi:hypothetical protein